MPRSQSRKDVNMKIEPFVFEAQVPKPLIGAKLPCPLKGPMYSVSVQVAVNTKALRPDAYLYVSNMRDDMDVDDDDE